MGAIRTTVKRSIIRICARTALRRAICWNVTGRDPLVAVTFDDGPIGDVTPMVLDILAEHQVPATFFLQGNHVEQHPAIVRRIAVDGHEIGNHGYDHSRQHLRSQVGRCALALRQQGIATRLFRPPGGAFGPSDLLWLVRSGYATVMWSFDAVDSMREEGKWSGPDPRYEDIVAGDVVLMHDDNATCVRDLPVLLTILKDKNLQPVTVSRLVGRTR